MHGYLLHILMYIERPRLIRRPLIWNDFLSNPLKRMVVKCSDIALRTVSTYPNVFIITIYHFVCSCAHLVSRIYKLVFCTLPMYYMLTNRLPSKYKLCIWYRLLCIINHLLLHGGSCGIIRQLVIWDSHIPTLSLVICCEKFAACNEPRGLLSTSPMLRESLGELPTAALPVGNDINWQYVK